MKRLDTIAWLLMVTLLTGCAYSVHIVNTGDFSPFDNRGAQKSAHMVTAEGKQFVILWFTDNINYADQAHKALEDSCKGGEIRGITSEYRTDLGFLSWTNSIIMKGWCLAAK